MCQAVPLSSGVSIFPDVDRIGILGWDASLLISKAKGLHCEVTQHDVIRSYKTPERFTSFEEESGLVHLLLLKNTFIP
jgi:hypothetical protein